MPLPLREYYPIERAAELLGCTIDDLICWGESGNIRLCLMLCNVNAFCRYDFSIFDEIIKKYKIPEVKSDVNCNNFIASYYAVCNYFKKDHRLMHEMDGEKYYDSALQLVMGFNQNLNSKINTNLNFIYGGNFDFKQLESFYSENSTFKIPVILNGFFPLNREFYTYKRYGVISNNTKTSYANISSFDFLKKLYITDNLEFYINDLFILKDDFVKIMNASKKGEELTKIPGYDYLSIFHEENNNKDKIITDTRNSATSIKIAKALIINYHPDIKSNPKKLAGILETEIKNAGLGDFSVSKDTISRWMKGDY
ncbi:hypothetical protein NA256_10880 [Salmonella sp. NW805]|uniref:hypothetical protein n=1 Tax=unclassified Salmonella TaxID=2614656 RepID=UPI003F43CB93|nr:hypothetical protein [Salmonella enterica]HBM0506694.1 hypothetical protein [Salmonella enterica]